MTSTIITKRKHKKLLIPNNKAISYNASKDTRFLTFPECPFLGFHSAMEKKIVKKEMTGCQKSTRPKILWTVVGRFPFEYEVFLIGNGRTRTGIGLSCQRKFSDNLKYLWKCSSLLVFYRNDRKITVPFAFSHYFHAS